jgi:spore maturation protein CgeB/GT2 family glycosyltransferase
VTLPLHPDGDDPAVLHARIAALEARLDEALAASASGPRDADVALNRALHRVQVLERDLESTKKALNRIRKRRILRLADQLVAATRSPVRVTRRALAFTERVGRRAARRLGIRKLLRLLGLGDKSGAARAALVESIVAQLGPAPAGEGRITILLDARESSDLLRTSLESLRDTDWPDLEVLVVGPTADRLVRFATGGADWEIDGRRWVRPVVGDTAAEARREAIAIATGDRIVFLHDDVRPIEPGWLRRLAAALDETGAGAVGARLLLPQGVVPAGSTIPPLSVAHLGIDFTPVDGYPEPVEIGLGMDPLDPATAGRMLRPAASEACLMVRRSTIEDVGLPLAAADQLVPVELCLRIRARGLPIFVEGDAVLWHRGALREKKGGTPRTADTPGSLVERWGPRLYRSVLLDRLSGEERWSSAPLRVGITLTRDDEAAGFGDWYTAHELGDALGRIGWEVTYLERFEDRWYADAADCDAIVTLLPQLDLFRIPRHVTSIAWIRNWTEAWTALPWFSNYDLVLASSERSRQIVEEQSAKVARVFPIATNPRRFYPRPRTPELRTEAVFTGSNWGAERGVASGLAELARTRSVGLHGRGWEEHPTLGPIAQGLAAYDDLPDIYASTEVAIDDAAISTKPYGSMNSRVFDALATGTIVVTDNEIGARELFDEEFPTWTDADDLVGSVNRLIDDPALRNRLVERYRRIVLERHTYDHRARELRDILTEWARAPRIAVHIGPQTWEAGSTWGDVPYGRDVQRQLERRGLRAALLVNAEGGSAAALCADVSLHIFGVRAPRTIQAQVNLLWVISHPDRVTESLCAGYDVIFLASDLLLEKLRGRVRAPLLSLHQATEPARFFPDPTGPKHQLLFIGNSRRVTRPVIEALRGTELDLAVYGGDWTADLLDPKHLRGEWVRNEELRTFYSSAEIVLNDHWGDMRELGIISNRVYDALACGAFVVSDLVPGIEEEFDGAVATWETREDLQELLRAALADPAGRAAAGARGRAAVLARHTFEQRVDRILEVLLPRLARQEPAVESLSTRTRRQQPVMPASPSTDGVPRSPAAVGAALDA